MWRQESNEEPRASLQVELLRMSKIKAAVLSASTMEEIKEVQAVKNQYPKW